MRPCGAGLHADLARIAVRVALSTRTACRARAVAVAHAARSASGRARRTSKGRRALVGARGDAPGAGGDLADVAPIGRGLARGADLARRAGPAVAVHGRARAARRSVGNVAADGADRGPRAAVVCLLDALGARVRAIAAGVARDALPGIAYGCPRVAIRPAWRSGVEGGGCLARATAVDANPRPVLTIPGRATPARHARGPVGAVVEGSVYARIRGCPRVPWRPGIACCFGSRCAGRRAPFVRGGAVVQRTRLGEDGRVVRGPVRLRPNGKVTDDRKTSRARQGEPNERAKRNTAVQDFLPTTNGARFLVRGSAWVKGTVYSIRR